MGRFAGVSRSVALAVALTTLGVMACLVLIAMTMRPSAVDGDSGRQSDLETYAAIADDMRHGANYYDAARAELLSGGYGTQSVFNWRTPLHPELVALAPTDDVAQVALGVLAVAAGGATMALLAMVGSRAAFLLGGTMCALALVTVVIPGSVFFAEVPAGMLILLSITSSALGHRRFGVTAGLLALFLRELSGAYVAVALALALKDRRWREVTAWSCGLVLYAAYFLWHRHQVLEHIRADDPAYPSGWVQFGGLEFVLRTAQMNGILFALPVLVAAILLPLALLGLAGSRHPALEAAALTVAAYLILFSVVGKPFNVYWGAMFTPLLILGVALLPSCIADLAASATGRRRDRMAQMD